MLFNATCNNISVISSLLVGETGVPREIHRPVAIHWQTWSHKVHPFLVKDEWKVVWHDTKWKVVKRGKKIKQTSNCGHDRMVVRFDVKQFDLITN
jgi:hypothetical protein